MGCGDIWGPNPELQRGGGFYTVAILRKHLGFGPPAGGGLPSYQRDALAPAGCMRGLVQVLLV